MRYEIPVTETPRLTMCREGMVFLGNKKSYEVIEINSRIITKAIDVDREHRMVAMEVLILILILFMVIVIVIIIIIISQSVTK